MTETGKSGGAAHPSGLPATLVEVLRGHAALRCLLPHSSGAAWSLHRTVWRTGIALALFAVAAAVRLLVQPNEARKFLHEVLPERARRPAGPGAFLAELVENVRAFLRNDGLHAVLARNGMKTLAGLFLQSDIEALAQAVEKHASLFTWREGDILLLDNQQLLHAGMPGYGPRELFAMFLNPLALNGGAAGGIAELPGSGREIGLLE